MTSPADAKLNQSYRDEGWGILAECAGYIPANTESAARNAFRFCWEILTEEQRDQLRKEQSS